MSYWPALVQAGKVQPIGWIPVIPGDVISCNARGGSSGAVTIVFNFNIVGLDNIVGTLSSKPVAAGTTNVNTTSPIKVEQPGFVVSGTVDYSPAPSGVAGTGPGDVYTEAHIVRAGSKIASLIRGYFFDGNVPAFPGAQLGPLDSPGRIYTRAGTQPSAGAEISDSLPPINVRWRIIAIILRLATDGTAGTRQPGILKISDGTSTIPLVRAASSTQTSQTLQVAYLPGYGINDTAYDASFATRLSAPVGLTLSGALGYTISTGNTTFIGSDRYSATWYVVEEWQSGTGT